MALMTVVAIPDMGETWRWLEASRHPSGELLLHRAGLDVPWGVGDDAAMAELLADAAIVRAFAAQRGDGSWGADERADARILPTLWVVKALIEAGLDAQVNQVDAALAFLADHATTDAGYFTVFGTDSGVLPCYVGLAARLWVDSGRLELVSPQVEWLTRFQRVSVAGVARRDADAWGHGLEKRFGGCFASTSCLIGIARAAEAWSRGDLPKHHDAYAIAREVLLERSLAFTRDGRQLLDLPAPVKSPGAWTTPAFPSDWRVDLIDVIHAVARGPHGADPRAQRAVEVLMASRRDDGSWARGWHVTSPFLKGFGAAPRGQGNPIATARALAALTLLAAGA
jgi:hypothetical protein